MTEAVEPGVQYPLSAVGTPVKDAAAGTTSTCSLERSPLPPSTLPVKVTVHWLIRPPAAMAAPSQSAWASPAGAGGAVLVDDWILKSAAVASVAVELGKEIQGEAAP